MTAEGVSLLVGPQKIILHGSYIEVLGRLFRQSGRYQCCCGVHPIDAPGHIILARGGKPIFSRPYFQGEVVWNLLCLTVLCQA